MSIVKTDDTVKVHYTGKLVDGQVFDSSEGRDPLEFKVGSGSLIPGFEQGVIGMAVNDTKIVNIPAEEAYGPVMEEMKQEVSKQQLPPDLKIEVGMQLMSQGQDGNQMVVTILDIKDESIVVDANHQLAGKDLIFDITVVEII